MVSLSTSVTVPSRTRYIITALLFTTGVVNYLDRTNLSITAPSLSGDLQIDPVTMGWLFSGALCSTLAVVAALCYIFLVGRMERVQE